MRYDPRGRISRAGAAQGPMSTENATPRPDRARSRRLLYVVAAIFLLPLAVAVVLRALGWQPGGQVNRGTLLDPPVLLAPMPATELGKRALPPAADAWTVIVVSGDGCGDACHRALDDTRKVVDLLGRDRDRVRRVLLATERLDRSAVLAQGDLIGVDAGASPNPSLREPFAGQAEGTVYVADPRHYLMLRYAPGQDPRDLLEDLKHLLQYAG
jgi:hypothetical protein